jgi:hypothetical protein
MKVLPVGGCWTHAAACQRSSSLSRPPMGWARSGRRTKASDETCYGWIPFWQAIEQFVAAYGRLGTDCERSRLRYPSERTANPSEGNTGI